MSAYYNMISITLSAASDMPTSLVTALPPLKREGEAFSGVQMKRLTERHRKDLGRLLAENTCHSIADIIAALTKAQPSRAFFCQLFGQSELEAKADAHYFDLLEILRALPDNERQFEALAEDCYWTNEAEETEAENSDLGFPFKETK